MATATSTMNDADKPKIEELVDEVALWNSYREARRAKGIDIAQLYADLAAEAADNVRSDVSRISDA